jgi:5-hydroxyisourate hydrolase-like protein (transthyretin family)
VNGVEHVAGKVAALGMTLTVSPNANVTHTVAPTNFTYQVSGGPASQNVKIEILDSSKAVVHTVTAGTALGADGSLELKNQAWQPSAAGTYTVKATVGSVYEATATIEVVNPATYNLINGSSLEKATIGVNDLTFGAGNIHLARFHIGAGGVPGLIPLLVQTMSSPSTVKLLWTSALLALLMTRLLHGTRPIRCA